MKADESRFFKIQSNSNIGRGKPRRVFSSGCQADLLHSTYVLRLQGHLTAHSSLNRMASTVECDRVDEFRDSPEDLEVKLQHLASLVRDAKGSVVFFTGAGVSTSAGINDYRGPSGCWTVRRLNKLQEKESEGSLSKDEADDLEKIRRGRHNEVPKTADDEAAAAAAATTAAKPEERFLHGNATTNNALTKRMSMIAAEPSRCHMSIASLVKRGMAGGCVTTNLDGIHRKSGLVPHRTLTELHGCIYAEQCTNPRCGAEFERNYHVRSTTWPGCVLAARAGADARKHWRTFCKAARKEQAKLTKKQQQQGGGDGSPFSRHVHDHATGPCPRCGSAVPSTYDGRPQPTDDSNDKTFFRSGLVGIRDVDVGLRDTHINFGEVLDETVWDETTTMCSNKALCIVAGTSLSLRHVTHFPFLARKTVIINLQRTPDDNACVTQKGVAPRDRHKCRIWATCDEVFDRLMAILNVPIDAVPAWRPKDAVPLDSTGSIPTSLSFAASAATGAAATPAAVAVAVAGESPESQEGGTGPPVLPVLLPLLRQKLLQVDAKLLRDIEQRRHREAEAAAIEEAAEAEESRLRLLRGKGAVNLECVAQANHGVN